LRYPAPGAPDLAERLVSVLGQSGIAARTDARLGFDHGMFIPLLLMFPNADIPVVQLSLKTSLNPVEHLAIHASRPSRTRLTNG
jgi:aromatic ring-opening dioxygenase catalytic subunit (LigB family)